MPTCNKCQDHFPHCVTIEGKKKNLSNRKYCLSCSPFGLHNTRKLDCNSIIGITKQIRVCSRCKKNYRGRGTQCGSCAVNVRRHGLKLKAVTYMGGKCTECNYKKCLGALQFHHIDQATKEFSFSGKHCLSWEKLRAELDKCVLVCSNCHAEKACRNPNCGIHF